ncbi:MAG: ComEC/Rec2 family competence protein [Candidatus Pacebacteria bacterium]|nr:ComEC/Rec2 family competence protein [Candidatus Paceibacterota bacterium]
MLFIGAIGFALGILASLSLAASGFIGLLGLLLLLAGTKRTLYTSISIFLLLVAIGSGRTLLMPTFPEPLRPLLNTNVVMEGRVVADPDIREESQRISLRTEEATVLAVVPLYPEVKYGEQVRVEGKLVLPEPFDTTGGRVFRYDHFLEKNGIFVLVERAHLEVLAPRDGALTNLRGFFSDVKTGFLASLATALPEPEAALAGGLVAGGKQGLGDSLLDAFIRSGLIHIVVLSGYNVMIVAEAVLRLLSVFPRRIATTAAALTIGAFVLAAGAGAASIRAGLMAGIALFARATYKTYDAVRALVVAGILMLLWNPLLLAYDPGFQLSFVATLGLILGAPLVERKLTSIKNNFIREIAASTIAAQISVLPLLLYQNGLFSVVALPANLLVLPVVPLAMAASALAGLAGFLIPTVAPIIGLPAYVLLAYIVKVVEVSSSLPLAAFSVPAFPFIITVLAYAGLGYYVWKNKEFIRAPAGDVNLLRSN